MESIPLDYEMIDIKEELPSDTEYDDKLMTLINENEKTIKPEESFQKVEIGTNDHGSLEKLRAARRYVKVKKIEEVKKKIDSGIYALEPKSGGRSDAWKKFQVIVESSTGLKTEFVQCKICEYIQKYIGTSTGTSQLLRHSCIKKNEVSTNPNKHCLSMILKSCVDFCSMDLQPLTVLKGIGFEKLAQNLINIGAKLGPTRIEDLMPDQNTLYVQVSQEVHIARQELFTTILPYIEKEEGAISLNTWIDNCTGHSYTNVLFHHIDKKWEFNSNLMFTVFNSENKKTYSEILNEIIQKFIRLGAPANTIKSITIVSEDSLEIDNDLEIQNQLSCVEVTLNRIIKNVLYSEFTEHDTPEIHQILSGLSSFVQFMNQSGLSTRLKQPIPLHRYENWQEDLHSLKLIIKQYNQICKLVRKTEEWIVKFDTEIAEDLVKFLQLFNEVIKDLLNDNKPNIHLVLLWYKKITNFCAERVGGNVVIKKMKANTIEALKLLFPINHQHKVSTFLWSSVRKMKMLTDLERVQFMQKLQTEINGMDSIEPEEEKDPLADNEPLEKRRKIHFHQWLENQEDGKKYFYLKQSNLLINSK